MELTIKNDATWVTITVPDFLTEERKLVEEDEDWISILLNAKVDCFRMTEKMDVLFGDIVRFYQSMADFLEYKTSMLEFSTTEDDFYMKGERVMKGSVKWSGYLHSVANRQNSFSFEFESEEGLLMDTINRLRRIPQIANDYPVKPKWNIFS